MLESTDVLSLSGSWLLGWSNVQRRLDPSPVEGRGHGYDLEPTAWQSSVNRMAKFLATPL